MSLQKVVFIDVTAEGESQATPMLRTLVANHFKIAEQEVQSAWVSLSLVGGMEGTTREIIEEACAELATYSEQVHGQILHGRRRFIIYME